MSSRLLHSILLQTKIASPSHPGESDQALLQRYHLKHDQTAFAELVQRYCRLVWSVCRQMLQDEADAEDAFQATFLALVKSSAMVKGPLAPWLHRVAFRIAQKQRKSTAKRRVREQQAAQGEAATSVSDSAWTALLAAVHEEVAKLPESLRVPFVLCCLEGWSSSAAAEQLGWKLGTFSGRLTQARQKLLARLAERGLPTTAIGLAIATAGTVSAIKPTLLTQAVQLALPGAKVAVHLLVLTQGVVTMKSTLFKSAAVILLLLGTAGTTSWLAASPQVPSAPTGTFINVDSVAFSKAREPDVSQGTMVPAPSGSNTLYLFHKLDKALSREDYVKLFAKYEKNGWEYAGTAPVLQVEKESASVQTTLVFRQPNRQWNTQRSTSQGINTVNGILPGPNDSLTSSSLQSNPPVTPNLGKTITEQEAKRRLEGSWKRVRAFHNGTEYAGGGLSTLRFSSNNIINLDGSTQEMHYFINPGKSPRDLTLVGKGVLFQCIYEELEADKILIAFYGRSEYDRPKSFSVKDKVADLPLFVYEYERVRR